MNIIHYLAVKLSTLHANAISIRDVLNYFGGKILIDAETSRLDRWIKEKIEDQSLSEHDLNRILITVQAKRSDAQEQVKYLNSVGLGVVLVRGHNSYLKNQSCVRDALENIVYIDQNYSVDFLAINKASMEKIQEKYQWINRAKLFGILGKDDTENSWAYYRNENLTDEGTAFLQRQGSVAMIDDFSQLSRIGTTFLYLDVHSRRAYIESLRSYEKSRQQDRVNTSTLTAINEVVKT